MPQLLHYAERNFCFATVRLKSEEICFISVAQTGVLIKSSRNIFGRFLVGFFGAILYKETNIYKAAQAAQTLRNRFPQNCLPVNLRHPVLSAFTNAVWQCDTAEKVATLLNKTTELSFSHVENLIEYLNEIKKASNAYTFIRVIGFPWLEDFITDGSRELAPEDYKKTVKDISRWLDLTEGLDISSNQEEKFIARFERFLIEGTAPTPSLAFAFLQLRQWLITVCSIIERANLDLSADITDWHKRILSIPRDKAIVAPD